jgi:hypothetical protein
MYYIDLTKGAKAIVDADDYKVLSSKKWYLSDKGYAERTEKNLKGQTIKIKMHREILKTPKGVFTDHINGNKLDNRRSNIRLCTKAQNACNRGLPKNNTSGHKGVCWYAPKEMWKAYIMKNRKQILLGYYANLTEASSAYNKASLLLHGQFSKPNVLN